MRTVIVVDDDPITRMDLVDILRGEKFNVLGEGHDGFDAVELCGAHRPDLVLMDIKMPIFDGLDATKTIIRDNLAGCVVILTAFNDEEFIAKAKEFGVSGYLVKPIDERMLIPAIEIALAQSQKFREVMGENENIKKKLEEKSLLDRAKALLAKKEGISEGEAYALIQKTSMDKSLGMAEVARKIVEATTDKTEVAEAKEILMDRYKIGENAAYRRIQRYCEQNSVTVSEAARRIIAKYTK